MLRRQAYRFQIRPNANQKRTLRCSAGACRYVYNNMFALQQAHYAEHGQKLSYAECCKQLTAWRKDKETSWLAEVPSQALQQAVKDLDRAYKNFFEKRANFPRFKKKGRSESFRYPQGIKLDQANSRIFLPKVGWVRYRNSQSVLGEIKNVTVSNKVGQWFISVQSEREVEQPSPVSTRDVGIDVGIRRFATFSDERFVEPLNSYKKLKNLLARRQKQLSRKVKFSQNWKKLVNTIQKLHYRIRNARNDFLHKLTRSISKNHALVCVEDLQIPNMSRSSKGNVENPGKQVKQKSGLNRAILDQGWGEFFRQLSYKLHWNGAVLVAVPAHHTSQTCPEPHCGHVSKESRKRQAEFRCVKCGYENHADVVAAKNILERGHRLLACGESVQSGRSMKQEPTEVAQTVLV